MLNQFLLFQHVSCANIWAGANLLLALCTVVGAAGSLMQEFCKRPQEDGIDRAARCRPR